MNSFFPVLKRRLLAFRRHRDTASLRLSFWRQWEKAKAQGAKMAAECLWPVEARFIRDCVGDNTERLKDGPYPFHEISSFLAAAQLDPLEDYPRIESESPRHHPLADARQSARLLAIALQRISEMRCAAAI